MNILILGYGQLGAAVGLALSGRGAQIFAACRSPNPEQTIFPVFQADVGKEMDMEKLAEKVPADIDQVIITAYPALRPDIPNPIPTCIRSCTRHWPRARIIYTSSTQVYADAHGLWLDEYGELSNSSLARAFLDAENAALDLPNTLILRLGQIVSKQRVAQMKARISEDEVLVPGSPNRWLNYIHEIDIVSTMHLACEDNSIRGCYNLTTEFPISVSDWLHYIATLNHRLIKIIGDERYAPNRRIDSSRIRTLCPNIRWHNLQGVPLPQHFSEPSSPTLS